MLVWPMWQWLVHASVAAATMSCLQQNLILVWSWCGAAPDTDSGVEIVWSGGQEVKSSKAEPTVT